MAGNVGRARVDQAAIFLSLVCEFGPCLGQVEQFEFCGGIVRFAGKANAGQRALSILVRTHAGSPTRREKHPAAVRQNRGGHKQRSDVPHQDSMLTSAGTAKLCPRGNSLPKNHNRTPQWWMQKGRPLNGTAFLTGALLSR